jgi:hypothetical protein
MGTVKDIYDIFFDIIDRATGHKKKKKRILSKYLGDIATLLKNIKEKLSSKEIPSGDSKELARLISESNKLAIPFKKEFPDLAQVFDSQLPNIGSQMQIADYCIDEHLQELRSVSHLFSSNNKNLNFSLFAHNQINQSCKELEIAAGIISA